MSNIDVKSLRLSTGLSQSKFASYFNIPLKTYQKWEQKNHVPPEYIPEMMKRILDLESELQKGD